jgi:hypothetical protein
MRLAAPATKTDYVRRNQAGAEKEGAPMRSLPAVVSAVLVAVAFGSAGAAAAADVVKHSGSIVAVDEVGGTIVLGEIGPWQVRNGETVVTYLEIEVTPATVFAIASRAEEGTEGFMGAFAETPIEPWAIYVTDYVTVDCLHEGARRVARKITVVDVP